MQTKRDKLLAEFEDLKHTIFGASKFVIMEQGELQKRYSQLLGYFYPHFRTEDWVNPENEPEEPE